MAEGELTPNDWNEGGEERKQAGKKGCTDRVKDYVKTTEFLVYTEATLSTWGDRMWAFAVALFLIDLSPGSLQLTAIYGFAKSISVLLLGAIIGDWIDRTPRLKAVRIALVIQNGSVALCAVVFALMDVYRKEMESSAGGWIMTLCQVLLIFIAVVAILAGQATSISLQKDWVAVIAGGEKERLANMNAAIRRIDLCTKILSPVVVGQIMTFVSMLVGALFIAGWNMVSMAIEYYLYYRVYDSVPALAVKESKIDKEEVNDENSEILTKESAKPDAPPQSCHHKMFHSFFTLYNGWKIYFQQTCFRAGLGLSCLYMTVLGFDNITVGFVYTQGFSELAVSLLMAGAAILGVCGTFIYPPLRKRIGLLRTGLISGTLQWSILVLCVASVWAPGSPFDPFYFTRTSNVTLTDVTLPPDVNLPPTFTPSSNSSVFSVSFNETIFPTPVDNTTAGPQDPPADRPLWMYTSVALLMTGVTLGRIGLWMYDLTVTQLYQETVDETHRGVVFGVQNSLNFFMDMMHFILVIVLPAPETFGFLILLSFVFTVSGHLLYASYSRQVRGHLFHFDRLLCGKCGGRMLPHHKPPGTASSEQDAAACTCPQDNGAAIEYHTSV
ncbi:solute carrier family 40 member 1-like [Branchiostoma floridae]|uniref:Solute carrier family 40 member n=1 Tax=Branchiostoma floridae TaxID=7739 RepID=A0A9J7LW59_BRAFL|nr:solute carrier family 40 member 1-like [Branchiostoma floridae]